MTIPLVETQGISRRFTKKLDFAAQIASRLGSGQKETSVHAVDSVDLHVNPGEAVGLVGESGCGKSTLGRMIAGIDTPSEGRILYRGTDIRDLAGADARLAALKIQMIFQDPLDSLNPRFRMGRLVSEAPAYHAIVPRDELPDYIDETLRKAGLDPSTKDRFPHQFSGGQRQRIGIARALAVKPELIVCDEAVASLDVSIQAQIINLFMALRQDLGLSYLFVSHDIGVVRHIADRVMVMYLGRIVEEGPVGEIFDHPAHPYTRALLREVPRLDRRNATFHPVAGEIPSPLDPPPGCHFHPRCPFAEAICREQKPVLQAVAVRHRSACHLNPDMVV